MTPYEFEHVRYTEVPDAGVVKLADARDSKSRIRKDVWVRLPPPAPAFARLRRATAWQASEHRFEKLVAPKLVACLNAKADGLVFGHDSLQLSLSSGLAPEVVVRHSTGAAARLVLRARLPPPTALRTQDGSCASSRRVIRFERSRAVSALFEIC